MLWQFMVRTLEGWPHLAVPFVSVDITLRAATNNFFHYRLTNCFVL